MIYMFFKRRLRLCSDPNSVTRSAVVMYLYKFSPVCTAAGSVRSGLLIRDVTVALLSLGGSIADKGGNLNKIKQAQACITCTRREYIEGTVNCFPRFSHLSLLVLLDFGANVLT